MEIDDALFEKNTKSKEKNVFQKNKDDLNDPVIESLKTNSKFKLCYCSAITRWEYILTLKCPDNSWYNSFEKLCKERKNVKNMGNSGLLGVKEDKANEINIYEYSRNLGAKPSEHSEIDIFEEILKKSFKKNTEIILSSYYCPCITCIGKIYNYVKNNPDIKINAYCFKFMPINKYPKLKRFITGKDYYKNCNKRLTIKGQNKCIINRYSLAFTGRSPLNGVTIKYVGEKENVPKENSKSGRKH